MGSGPSVLFYWGSLKNGVFSTFFWAKVPDPIVFPLVVEKSSDGLGGI